MNSLNTFTKLIISYIGVFLILFSYWQLMIYTSENNQVVLFIIIGFLVPVTPLAIYLVLKNNAMIRVEKNEASRGMNE